MLRTSERITVYMYMLYKSPDLCWSVNTFSTVRGKKKIYANVYQNTINDDDSQTSSSPIIFSEGRGVSVRKLLIAMILRHW